MRLATQIETPSPIVGKGFTAPKMPALPAKSRSVNLGHGYQATDIFLGADMKPGNEVTGPAIIEESFTTIVVYPGWKAQVDDAGDYELIRT